jgi:probable addiction module antidote protein
MTNIKTSRFDVAEYLTDETLINAYLNEILTDGMPSEFIQALNDVARAKGMNELAQKTGIRRESLYKTLQSEKPRFDTMLKIIDAMGLQVTLTPKQEPAQLTQL